ncbi:MAG TPA: HD domain-containing phosphohydrolase [bacterium]|nr:HD domain-containing phosphohydrolase [bacterium]
MSTRIEVDASLLPASPPPVRLGARTGEEWISLVRVLVLLSLIPALWFEVIRVTHPAVTAIVMLLGGYVIMLAVGPQWIALLRKADLIIALDIIVVTVVVVISGGLGSPFLYLYYLTILEAVARLNLRQALASSMAMAGMIIILWLRAGQGAALETTGFRLGAFIAGGFFLALVLDMAAQEYRTTVERTWWGGLLDQAQAQRTAELEAFYDLSRRLRAARNADEMYPILVAQAMQLLQADHGTLALLADGQTLIRVCAVGKVFEQAGGTFSVAGSPFGRAVQTGAAYITDDFATAASIPGFDPSPFLAVGPIVIVPVRSERETIGTLGLGRKRSPGTRPFTDAEVRLLDGIAEVGGTAIRRARLYQNLEQSYLQMVLALARTMDARDSYTAGHSERIAHLAEAVARGLGCGDDEIRDVRWGALLHDIGKIGVPDEILRKSGPLTASEQIVMRQHPVVGEGILAPTERMHGVARIVRHHQERWDGSGYPDGVEGEDIPLGARILAVVDTYSAITDDRPYKQAQSHEEAIAELRGCAGTRFDPRIVDVFCQVIDRVKVLQGNRA